MGRRGATLAAVAAFVGAVVGWLVLSEGVAPWLIRRGYGGEAHALVGWFLRGWDFPTLDAYLAHWAFVARLLTAGLVVSGAGALVLLHPPPGRGGAGRRPLWATKAALLTVATGLSVIGPRPDVWPLLTAAVYTDVHPAPHPTTMTELDLHVVDRAGGRHVLEPHEFFGQGRAFEARYLLERAVAADSGGAGVYRRYLTSLTGYAFPSVEPAAFEVWRTEWDVDAFAHPPFAHESPERRVRVGRLSPEAAPPPRP